MKDRRNVGENICNSGDGTDQTGPVLDVYDDDDDDDEKTSDSIGNQTSDLPVCSAVPQPTACVPRKDSCIIK